MLYFFMLDLTVCHTKLLMQAQFQTHQFRKTQTLAEIVLQCVSHRVLIACQSSQGASTKYSWNSVITGKKPNVFFPLPYKRLFSSELYSGDYRSEKCGFHSLKYVYRQMLYKDKHSSQGEHFSIKPDINRCQDGVFRPEGKKKFFCTTEMHNYCL